jgi:hypothetical protein
MAKARVAQSFVEVLVSDSAQVRVTQEYVEILVAETAASPTTITGAGVTQQYVEVLVADQAAARVTQQYVEALYTDTSTTVGVTQQFVEILIQETAASPTTITGAGVTQHYIEVIVRDGSTASASFSLDAISAAGRTGSLTLDATFLVTAAGSLTLDAVITGTATVSGSFTLDAVLLATVSGSATLDAITKATSSASFTLDAILIRTTSASYTLDAIKLRTGAGSFTFNAILRGTVSASFTLDASILGLTTFTLDAYFVRTSFTLDACLVQLIDSDDFNRTEAVGWGRRYEPTAAYLDTLASVNGSYAIVDGTTASPYFEPRAGLHRPRSGYVQWDFWVPANRADTAFYFANDSANPDGTFEPSEMQMYSANFPADDVWEFNIYPSDLRVQLVLDPNTWYTVKGYFEAVTGGALGIKVWPRDDPEPDTWTGYDATGHDHYLGTIALWESAFWCDAFAATGQDAQIDNILMWRSTTDPFEFVDYLTLDAFLVRTAFELDAVIIDPTVVRSGLPSTNPEVIGSSGNSSWPAVSSISVAKPTGTLIDDFMVAAVLTDASGAVTASGWSATYNVQFPDGSHAYIFTRTAQSGEPSSYTFFVSPIAGINVIITTVRDVTGVQTINQTSTDQSPYDVLTTAVINWNKPGLLLAVFQSASFGPGDIPVPSGLTEIREVQDYYVQQEVSYLVDLSIGGVRGPFTTTITNPDAGSPWRNTFVMLLGRTGSGIALDAVIRGKYFTFDAVLAGTVATKTFTLNAAIATPGRRQHSRGNEAHFDVDLDVVIVLAGALGIYPGGMTLHDLLIAIEARITALENSS